MLGLGTGLSRITKHSRSQAKPSRDRHRDRGRHSTLGVFSASCQTRQRIRTGRKGWDGTVRLASDCDSDISMSPCLHPHPLPVLSPPFPPPTHNKHVSSSAVSRVSAVSFAFNFYLPCYKQSCRISYFIARSSYFKTVKALQCCKIVLASTLAIFSFSWHNILLTRTHNIAMSFNSFI